MSKNHDMMDDTGDWAVSRLPSCSGDCGQGRRACTCFRFMPAEACTEIGAEAKPRMGRVSAWERFVLKHGPKIIAAALLVTAGLLFCTKVKAADCSSDGWACKDKAMHFAGSAAIAAAVTVASKDQDIGFWTTVAIGAAKEAYDARHRDRHTPSWRDMGADIAGAYLGSRLGMAIVIRRNEILISKQF